MTLSLKPWTIGLSLACLSACSAFPPDQRRMESFAELNAKQDRDFAASPDMQLPELRNGLLALGIREASLVPAVDGDYGVPIFLLHLGEPDYAKLDKRRLAKLELDSRYRFRLTDPRQIRDFAEYSVAEDRSREKAISIKELADNGELDRFPRYVAGRSMNIYARQLEVYCGYPAGYALSVTDGKWLAYENRIASDAAMAGAQGQSYANFACLRRIVYATDLGAYFIGNRPTPGAIDT
jgi:hypothetical protein